MNSGPAPTSPGDFDSRSGADSPTPLERTRRSPKSYGIAVALSGIFGFVGVQHFYLGRWFEGLVDVSLSIGWIYCFAIGEPLWAMALMVLDFGHSTIVTIMLLVGAFEDGQGRRVCYPGQKVD